MDALVTSGLTKVYGHREPPIHRPGHRPAGTVRALEDLSIAVREGEIFGFLGPNGAGKSTTIRLLLGYLHPTSGSASVLGLDVVRESVEIRRRVGYLPGGIALYDSLSGERLLDYLGDLTGRPSVRRAELCDRLELSARTLRRTVRDYSRGMRQKIGIVQALQHDPELAVLDEPTEGLDPLMQRAFYGILDDLRAAGRTIFFSSHILSEVERVCDRVAIVRRGRLVALEDVDRLLERRKRNVELRVAGDPPRLEGVPGVSGVVVAADGRITCQLDGDVGPFLAAIAGSRVTDLTIEPAHLEEAFLELYEDGDPNGDEDGEAPPEPAAPAPAPPPAAPPTATDLP
jgi:ABC-2 type transport system ATP-binding protein